MIEDGKIVVGKPVVDIEEVLMQSTNYNREAAFIASDYARLLHVLADTRLETARSLLMEPRSRQQLDQEPNDPWTSSVAPLFNDPSLEPEKLFH